jgi:para-nitrobenzyl esterase
LAGENPPQELADQICKLWAGYIRTGALPWPEYEPAERLVYAPESREVARDRDMPAGPLLP